jgi:hypothetical protein
MRRQEGQVVEKYTHPRFGGEYPIRFRKGDGDFVSNYGDQRFECDSIHEVRKLLKKAIESSSELIWVPVINIYFGRRWSGNDENRVSFGYNRNWMAQKVDGKWLKAEWETEVYKDDEKRKFGEKLDRLSEMREFSVSRYIHGNKTDLPFKIPFTDTFDSGSSETPHYYLEYTEELWTMLEKLEEALGKLQNRIIEYLGNDKLRAMLVANVSKLLPAPEEKKGRK